MEAAPRAIPFIVSTHSRAEAAAMIFMRWNWIKMFQHTAARRRLLQNSSIIKLPRLFQHTAARRRLQAINGGGASYQLVSTHSRAEAAAFFIRKINFKPIVSTHSRAEAAAILDYISNYRK